MVKGARNDLTDLAEVSHVYFVAAAPVDTVRHANADGQQYLAASAKVTSLNRYILVNYDSGR